MNSHEIAKIQRNKAPSTSVTYTEQFFVICYYLTPFQWLMRARFQFF